MVNEIISFVTRKFNNLCGNLECFRARETLFKSNLIKAFRFQYMFLVNQNRISIVKFSAFDVERLNF